MSEQKKLQLAVSVPFTFRWKKDELSDILLYKSPERETVYRYFMALLGEIENCGGGLDDVEVDAIRFVGGGVHFFWQQDLRRIMERIRESFALTPDVELISYGEPGQLSGGPCAVMKEYGFKQIVDIASFSLTECQRSRTAFKGGQSFQKYRDMEIPVLGLRTSMGLSRRTKDEWVQQTEGILSMEPEIVELRPALCEQDAQEEGAFFARMQAEGYNRVRPYLLTRGYVPKFDYHPGGEYLGVGLDASCRLDGYQTRNTDNLEYYIQNADDYSKLYRLVETYDA